MRTTIDLPDDLLRKAKATAALRGMKLKDLVTLILREALSNPQSEVKYGQHRPLPATVIVPGIKPMTGAEIDELFVKEDIAKWSSDGSS